MATPSRAPGASLERYLRHWRERGALMKSPIEQQQAIGKPMTIAISRERGVGGVAIAEKIASKLDWLLYDRQLVERIAKDTGVCSQLLEGMDEKPPRWLTECLDGFKHEKTISGSGFAARLLEVLCALSCRGNCVVLGRGAAQILPAESTLRVRLIAPLEERVARVQQQRKLSHADALKEVEEADRQRAAFVKKYFHKDVNDPYSYDLTINPFSIGEDGVVAIILLAQKERAEMLAK